MPARATAETAKFFMLKILQAIEPQRLEVPEKHSTFRARIATRQIPPQLACASNAYLKKIARRQLAQKCVVVRGAAAVRSVRKNVPVNRRALGQADVFRDARVAHFVTVFCFEGNKNLRR